jgi:hypothetical protein
LRLFVDREDDGMGGRTDRHKARRRRARFWRVISRPHWTMKMHRY